MKLEILILTQRSRHLFLSQLLSLLEPQLSALGLRKFDQVDIRIEHDEKFPSSMGVGDKRECIRRKASGDYIAWVDDDDLVPPYYISSILPLLDGVDIIGWEQEVYKDGVKTRERDFHTISAPGWFNDANFHRDISHQQPIRRELALLHPMSGGVGEDARWAEAMRGSVKTEHYIDRIMYYYFWRTEKNDAKDANDPWRLEMLEKLRGV